MTREQQYGEITEEDITRIVEDPRARGFLYELKRVFKDYEERVKWENGEED